MHIDFKTISKCDNCGIDNVDGYIVHIGKITAKLCDDCIEELETTIQDEVAMPHDDYGNDELDDEDN